MADIYEQALKNVKKKQKSVKESIKQNTKTAIKVSENIKAIEKANEEARKEEAAKKKAEAEKKKAASGGKNKSNGTNKTTNGKKTNLPQKKGSNADKELVAIQKADKKESLKSRKSSTVTNFQQERRTKTKKAATEVKDWAVREGSWAARDIKAAVAGDEKESEKVRKEQQDYYESIGGFHGDKIGQFYTGLGMGLLDYTVGLPYSWATGKKLSESELFGGKEAVEQLAPNERGAAARTAGDTAALIASYADLYRAAGGLTSRAAGKVLSTGAGKKVMGSIVNEGTKDTVKALAKDAIADATVGTAMNYGVARGQGLEGEELKSDMKKNALIDVVTGGLMDTAPWVLKTLKNTKLAKQAGNLVDEAVDGAKTATKQATEETAETVTKTAAEQKNDYLQELANKIKNIDEQKAQTSSRTATDGRRTQTNRRVQNAKAVINNEVDEANRALNSEYDELINEFAEVAGMEPDDFVEWQAKKAADDIPDTIVDPNTGETIPNPAKQADTMEDPLTGETVPSTKQADTVIDPETGETVPNSELKDMFDGVDEADLSPESKAKVYKAVEERTGVKVVEKALKKGDGFYRDGVIYINSNSTKPKFTVLKHELTHYMQTSKNYDAFSEFIFDGLRRKGKDIDALRADKRAVYKADGVDLTDEEVDFELVAEFCGEFLFNSEKSIDRLARKDPNLLRWLYEWAVDTIKKLGADEDTKFLINAQRKYEKALKDAKVEVNGKSQYLFTKGTGDEAARASKLESHGQSAEEIKEQTNLHRGFGDDWLFEVDDSGAKINETALDKLKKGETVSLRELLDHDELWKRLDDSNIDDIGNYKIVPTEMLEAIAYTDPEKKIIELSNLDINSGDEGELLDGILHEVQHTIQDSFGLPSGAAPAFWYNVLKNNGGYEKELAKRKEAEKAVYEAYDKLKKLADAHNIKISSIDKSTPYLDTEKVDDIIFDFDRKAFDARVYASRETRDVRNAVADINQIDREMYRKAENAYYNTAGEIEAFDVSDRRLLSKSERRKELPRQKNKRTRYVEDYPDNQTDNTKQYLFTRATDKEAERATKREQVYKHSPEKIKNDINLHRGFKDDWLFEVDDSGATLNKTYLNKLKNGETVNLRNLLKHDELWNRIKGTSAEGIENYRVVPTILGGGTAGKTDIKNKIIKIDKNLMLENGDESFLITMLHEVQHALQGGFNLPNGASPEFWEKVFKNDGTFKEELLKRESEVNKAYEALENVEKLNTKLRNVKFYEDDVPLDAEIAMENLQKFRDKLDDKGLSTEELDTAIKEAEQALYDVILRDTGMYKKAKDAYKNTAGEIEAGDVEKRLPLSKEKRKGKLPDQKDENTLYAEEHMSDFFGTSKQYSLGKNTIEDEALKKTSQNLYGEKGNKYLQGGKSLPETQKKASKGTQATIDETAKVEKTLPTNGKAESGKKLPKKQAVSKSVSADEKNPKAELTYEQAAELYETYKNGTPKTLPAKGDVSKAADTIIGSDYIGDEMRTAIKENIDNAVKTTKSNKVTLDNVNAKIDKDGLTPSVKKFLKNVQKKNRFTEEDIATGAELLRRLDEKGDYETALDVTDGLIELMSQAGRTLQAANIFTSMTPYGKLRTIRKAAAEMSERYGKEVKLNEDLLRELFYEKDTVKADKIKRRLFNDLWDQIPATLGEKIDALRYTAMLSSPKTHIRNILGNVAMYVGKALSDGVETALEETVFKGKMNKMGAMRAKSMLNPFSKEDRMLKEKAGELFENIKDQLLNESSKYLEKGKVRPQENKVFNSKILEAGRKFVSGSLEKEDEWFMKINFQAAFAKICKANGLEVGELTAKEIRKFTAYAAEQAQAATFRDPNALASAMNKVYRYASDTSKSDVAGKIGKGILKTTMDTAVPFRRTPANILKQAWRYSPGGVAEGLARVATAKDAESLMKGIEILSNGVVGTPVVLAGAYAAYQGYVTGNVGDYSDKTASYNRMLGEQDYSLKVGDKTITLDWMSPYSMPFFVGAELGTALSEQGLTGLTATEMVDAMASITEPFLEMSMMQGLQDLMTNNYKGNATEVFVGNAMKSYVSQFVPTFAAQLAKTMAKTTSSTKTVNDGTTSGKIYTSMVAQMKSKVPGLYETNVDEVDVWGRTETKEDVWDYVRAGLRNILSPSTIKDINVTDVDKEILSVYDSLDDDKASVIPSTADSYVNYNSTKYDMTDSEWADFKKDIGKLRYDGLEDLFKTSSYKNASAKDKAKTIQNVYSNALQTAKKNYLISSGKMTKEEYNRSTLTSGAATKLIDQGKTTATKVVEAKEKVNKSGVTNKAILQAYVLAGSYDSNTIKAVGGYNSNGSYKISDNTISEAKALKSAGVTLSKLQKAYAQSDENNNKSISREEAEAYLDSVNWSQDQKRAIFDALMTNPNTHNKY